MRVNIVVAIIIIFCSICRLIIAETLMQYSLLYPTEGNRRGTGKLIPLNTQA